ncbi:MAG: hypothetical protein ACLGIM_17045, partial [Alphaproteobacteria bacterium]
MKASLLRCAAGAMILAGFTAHSVAMANDSWKEADTKARAIVDQLTLDEKVEQLLNVAPAIP